MGRPALGYEEAMKNEARPHVAETLLRFVPDIKVLRHVTDLSEQMRGDWYAETPRGKTYIECKCVQDGYGNFLSEDWKHKDTVGWSRQKRWPLFLYERPQKGHRNTTGEPGESFLWTSEDYWQWYMNETDRLHRQYREYNPQWRDNYNPMSGTGLILPDHEVLNNVKHWKLEFIYD
jgi:hypothetical protein